MTFYRLVHEGKQDAVAYDLSVLFLISAVFNTIILLLVVLCKFFGYFSIIYNSISSFQ
jgi:hypothetical protein